MCGINGIILSHSSSEIINSTLSGLEELEYRGYDSCGISFLDEEGKVVTLKKVGFVSLLREELKEKNLFNRESVCCISHTRWSTNGIVSLENSHPFVSGEVSIVHNGIIENYTSLKEELSSGGYTFSSETDSEAVAHLFHYYHFASGFPLFESILKVIEKLEGSFSLLILTPTGICGVRKESPLIVGFSDSIFVSSDVIAFPPDVSNVTFLPNETFFIVDFSIEERMRDILFFTFSGESFTPHIEKISPPSPSTKKNFSTFMEKEIIETPEMLRRCILSPFPKNLDFSKYERIILIGCGSSYYSSLFGKYVIEKYTSLIVEVDYASEFRYRNPSLRKDKDLLIALSQSGESCDTLFGIKTAKERGITTLCVCNSRYSSISRECDYSFFLDLGVEKSVAATKSFSGMCLTLLRLALRSNPYFISREREITSLIIEEIEKTISESVQDSIHLISEKIYTKINCLYLGRGMGYSLALEGALKLKEVSGIHAEGISSAELKHGHIALVDEEMPIIVIGVPKNTILYSKVINNIHEVKSRKGKIILISDCRDDEKECDDFIFIGENTSPCEIEEETFFLKSIIPIQLLALRVASLRKKLVDTPSNLSKTVSVE